MADTADNRPSPLRCSFEFGQRQHRVCDRAPKAPSTRGPRRRVWMLQIVVCSTAARASGLPLRPDVHNAAERDRSADSGRARQPIFRPRHGQPCSFCGRRCGALGGWRLGRSHVTEAYRNKANRPIDLAQVRAGVATSLTRQILYASSCGSAGSSSSRTFAGTR